MARVSYLVGIVVTAVKLRQAIASKMLLYQEHSPYEHQCLSSYIAFT
ncbi:hypothetical protein KBT16_01915 [Nostoc sp. CCCryo 231-06]|nr:hypothetical protein [Nostoc sp. CCCryo 231-06]